MPTPTSPDPQQIAALPGPLRRRFLRVYRTFAVGLFLGMGGISVAVLVPGRPRTYGLLALAVGAVLALGALGYAWFAGTRAEPPPVDPPVGPSSPTPRA